MTRRPLDPIVRNGSSLSGFVVGEGQCVVLIPSLGRGAEDFTQLAQALSDAGYCAVALDPRGIGSSTGPTEKMTLHDYAADVAAVIEAIGKPADVVGHAFGNRVARCLASDRPDLVRRVVLLAAGGRKPLDADVRASLGRCFQLELPDEVRLKAIGDTFFAPESEPAVWRDGWWPEAAAAQVRAVERTPPDDWLDAGSTEVLIVQGLHDRAAPPLVGRSLVDELGDRATLVELPNSGHAMLPEEPEKIAGAVVAFLDG